MNTDVILMNEKFYSIEDNPELLYNALSQVKRDYKQKNEKIKANSNLSSSKKQEQLINNENNFKFQIKKAYKILEKEKFPNRLLSHYECEKDVISDPCIDNLLENAKRLNQHIRSQPNYTGKLQESDQWKFD